MTTPAWTRLLILPFCAGLASPADAASPADEMSPAARAITTLTSGRTSRISPWDRTGGNKDGKSIPAGETLTLAEIKGSGTILHFYIGTTTPSRAMLRELVLRMYWDGETKPSVEVPFGDFFLTAFETFVQPIQTAAVVINPGTVGLGSHGYHSYLPMPFGRGARITIENQAAETSGLLFYHIEYESYQAEIGEEIGRLHAQWSMQATTAREIEKEHRNQVQWPGTNLSGRDNYVILDAKGKGHLVGLLLNVENTQPGWYGEGDEMIFIDGETWPPSYHGTGTEEIFGGGACPDRPYISPYCGFLVTENSGGVKFAGKASMFRWYLKDPVRFSKSIRWTVEHGHANNFENVYSSVAFWYQTEPHKPFPPLPPAQARLPSMPEGYYPARAALFATQDALPRLDKLTAEDKKRLRPMRVEAHRLFQKGLYNETLAILTQHAHEVEKTLGPGSFPLP